MRSILLPAVLCLVVPAWAGPEPSSSLSPSNIAANSDSQTSVDPGSLDQTEEVSAAKTSRDAVQSPIVKINDLCETVASVAVANNLPVTFFANLIQQESGFKPLVVSRAGAQGIAQFMPRVAASYGLADPFEPIAALTASGKLLAELVAKFGNVGLAAAAYNAGPSRVRNWIEKKGRLPSETLQYVQNITGRPAEQWVKGPEERSGVHQQWTSHCPAIQEKRLATASGGVTASQREVLSYGIAGSQVPDKGPNGARHSMPQPSQFAIGLPISRFAAIAQPLRSKTIPGRKILQGKLRSFQEPAMVSFLRMPTPRIMIEDDTPNRRKLSVPRKV